MSIFERIQTFNSNRPASLLQEKWKRIAKTPSRFYRGTCHLFYEDLALAKFPLPDSPLVWVCGDLHLENFGSYTGLDGNLYYDLNDFDESSLAPANWELGRFLTSIVLTFKELGFDETATRKACQIFLKNYSTILEGGNPKSALGLDNLKEAEAATKTIQNFLKAMQNANAEPWIDKLTQKDEAGNLVFKINEKKRLSIEAARKQPLMASVTRHFKQKRLHLTVLDACIKVSGNSSLGVERYLWLVRFDANAPLVQVLDMKEAIASVLPPSLPSVPQPAWANEAKRIETIQKRLQSVPPPLLTACVVGEKSFLIKKVLPTSEKLAILELFQDLETAHEILANMGHLTALAHLRGGNKQGAASKSKLRLFAQNMGGHSQEIVTGLLNFAFAYAQQVESDFKSFCTAYNGG